MSLTNTASAPPPKWRTALVVAMVILFVALAVLGLRRFMKDSVQPKQQVARIAVLPDKLPPPPPPPPKERKEDLPKPNKEQAPTPQPKPQDPAPAPLKMEGAAGTGPSAFAAGSVTQDYRGGTPTIGGQAASGIGNDSARRAQERLYANAVRQLLRDELERHLSPDAGELTATFALWVETNGHVSRWEIEDRDAQIETRRQAALQTALDKSAERLQLPPQQQALAQPMRFRLTVRPGG
jgi:periplasmic protein TonB